MGRIVSRLRHRVISHRHPLDRLSAYDGVAFRRSPLDRLGYYEGVVFVKDRRRQSRRLQDRVLTFA